MGEANQPPKPLFRRVVQVPLLLVVVVLILMGGIAASILISATNIAKDYPIFVPIILNNSTSTFVPPGIRTNYTFISPEASATSNPNPPDSEWEVEPCVSVPDNEQSRFVFRIWLERSMELFRVGEDGNGLCYLTHDEFLDDQPKWSPDGRKIVFVSNRNGYGIYVMDADGSHKVKLTGGGSAYSFPAWSPDGQQIIFQATLEERFDLYMMNADGTNLHNLTNDPRLDISPAWSPDGQYITFASDRTFNPFIFNRLDQPQNYEIYLMTPDGLNIQRLTSNDTLDAFPSWSPDSLRIAFVSFYDDIILMNKDGSDQRFLTKGRNPIWLSDGKRLAFVRDGVYFINTDGTELKQVLPFRSEYIDYWVSPLTH